MAMLKSLRKKAAEFRNMLPEKDCTTTGEGLSHVDNGFSRKRKLEDHGAVSYNLEEGLQNKKCKFGEQESTGMSR
jgi:hypothetical protein